MAVWKTSTKRRHLRLPRRASRFACRSTIRFANPFRESPSRHLGERYLKDREGQVMERGHKRRASLPFVNSIVIGQRGLPQRCGARWAGNPRTPAQIAVTWQFRAIDDHLDGGRCFRAPDYPTPFPALHSSARPLKIRAQRAAGIGRWWHRPAFGHERSVGPGGQSCGGPTSTALRRSRRPAGN